VVNAAQGLRRELALSPTDERPADGVVAATGAVEEMPGQVPQLDRLLALPRVHLVIDGYNVTKTGYGDLTLEAQRHRLVSRLGGIAAQTGAEVTVVFDGADRLPVAPPTPRGVRVLFSQIGETADELIHRLVGAEPQGRPLVVVSTDREVADDARRSGAHAVAASVLLARLGQS
jgi:predicted RNA-binding protein with PIN domain